MIQAQACAKIRGLQHCANLDHVLLSCESQGLLPAPDAPQHSGERLGGALAVGQWRRHGLPRAALRSAAAPGRSAVQPPHETCWHQAFCCLPCSRGGEGCLVEGGVLQRRADVQRLRLMQFPAHMYRLVSVLASSLSRRSHNAPPCNLNTGAAI